MQLRWRKREAVLQTSHTCTCEQPHTHQVYTHQVYLLSICWTMYPWDNLSLTHTHTSVLITHPLNHVLHQHPITHQNRQQVYLWYTHWQSVTDPQRHSQLVHLINLLNQLHYTHTVTKSYTIGVLTTNPHCIMYTTDLLSLTLTDTASAFTQKTCQDWQLVHLLRKPAETDSHYTYTENLPRLTATALTQKTAETVGHCTY